MTCIEYHAPLQAFLPDQAEDERLAALLQPLLNADPITIAENDGATFKINLRLKGASTEE